MAKLNIKKNKFGTPPPIEQIKKNLEEPEIITNHQKTKKQKIDGRSLRKTGFSHQLNVKVPKNFKQELLQLSKKLDITLGRLLVDGMNCYKKKLKHEDKIKDSY